LERGVDAWEGGGYFYRTVHYQYCLDTFFGVFGGKDYKVGMVMEKRREHVTIDDLMREYRQQEESFGEYERPAQVDAIIVLGWSCVAFYIWLLAWALAY
jgi:hypothetical protein